ncbi:MAG: hypothetical protein HFI91_04095 [Lachnospiraceae bacterium]|nr:hypothetical protein [Lachnospiraceae bacterium]
MKRRERKKRQYELRKLQKLQRQRQKRQRKKTPGKREAVCDREIVYSDTVNELLTERRFTVNGSPFGLGRKIDMTVPPCFSMTKNPDETILWIRKLYTYGQDLRIETICFNHLKCYDIDLAASTFMDIVVVALKRYREKKRQPIYFEGQMPSGAECTDILMASGIVRHLRAFTKGTYDTEMVKPFHIVERRHGDKKTDKIATEMTQYYDNCLKKHGYSLTLAGKTNLSNIFGEIFINCDSHGGEHSLWYALGHYQFRKNEEIGEMQLTFLTLGNTIYEGISKESTEETKWRLEKLFERHKGQISGNWTREMIATVFSLQEGVSRLRDSKLDGHSSRGNGTINMMSLLNRIGLTEKGEVPELSITSGNTQILLNKKYRLSKHRFTDDKIFGNKELNIIAFNDTNDIYKKADPDSVYHIKQFFPGTAISIRFYMDSRYMERLYG